MSTITLRLAHSKSYLNNRERTAQKPIQKKPFPSFTWFSEEESTSSHCGPRSDSNRDSRRSATMAHRGMEKKMALPILLGCCFVHPFIQSAGYPSTSAVGPSHIYNTVLIHFDLNRKSARPLIPQISQKNKTICGQISAEFSK